MKINYATPQIIPDINGINKDFPDMDGKLGISNSVLVSIPNNDKNFMVICAEATEIEAPIIKIGDNRLCNSSIENIIDVMGDEVAIEKPAVAPPVIM